MPMQTAARVHHFASSASPAASAWSGAGARGGRSWENPSSGSSTRHNHQLLNDYLGYDTLVWRFVKRLMIRRMPNDSVERSGMGFEATEPGTSRVLLPALAELPGHLVWRAHARVLVPGRRDAAARRRRARLRRPARAGRRRTPFAAAARRHRRREPDHDGQGRRRPGRAGTRGTHPQPRRPALLPAHPPPHRRRRHPSLGAARDPAGGGDRAAVHRRGGGRVSRSTAGDRASRTSRRMRRRSCWRASAS